MDGDEVLAGDEQVHLVQRLGVLGAVAPSAVEDEKDVIVVVVELGALAEMLGVLERERVKAEDLPQLGELVGAGAVEVEPKELIAPRVIPDARLVDAGEARHHESKLFACGLRRRCFGLADGHPRLLVRCCRAHCSRYRSSRSLALRANRGAQPPDDENALCSSRGK